jgi:hypothetical protein
MPKSRLKADIFLKKGVGVSKRTGILIGSLEMMRLCERPDLIEKEDSNGHFHYPFPTVS